MFRKPILPGISALPYIPPGFQQPQGWGFDRRARHAGWLSAGNLTGIVTVD